ncbi:MAG TPA: flippase activity-associated protein Agl23 [Solirubrobacteraceae bacterium]
MPGGAPARRRWEPAAIVALLALALALRTFELGDRAFHHDESQDAYFSFTHRFEYDPLLHGPLRFYLTAAIYGLLGASDFTARLAPALLGTAMVGLVFLAREQIGRLAAWVAAILLAAGPSFLYFSRFAREDIYIACVTLALLVVVLRFLDAPRPWHPAALGALLAASFAIKESTYITVFVGGTFFLLALAVQAVRQGWREAPLVRTVARLGWEPWAWGGAALAIVYTLLFTVFFTYPDGLWKGVNRGLEYWTAQQDVARGGEPVGFYAFLLFGMELPVVLLGMAGVVAIARKPSTGRWLLVWMFAGSLAAYSWASEKFAWLVIHPLLPLILLAGIGAQALWAARGRWFGRAGLALAAVGAAFVAWSSLAVNALHPADPRELLVSTQTSEEVTGLRDEILGLERRAGRKLTITVDQAEGAAFPWAWYLRDTGAGFYDSSSGRFPLDADVLILTDAARERFGPQLTGYRGRRFHLRVWWVKDFGEAWSPAAWAKYWVTRKPWNPTGGLTEWIYTRQTIVSASSTTRVPSRSSLASPSSP